MTDRLYAETRDREHTLHEKKSFEGIQSVSKVVCDDVPECIICREKTDQLLGLVFIIFFCLFILYLLYYLYII